MNDNRKPTEKQAKRQPHPPVANDKAGHWYQYINRYWMRFLSGSEIKVVLFILDAQLGWQKTDPKRISRNRFAKGVIGSRDGMIWHGGTGLSDSTIDAALRSLENRDIISVTRRKQPDRVECLYSLNWYWLPTKAGSTQDSQPRQSGRPPQERGQPHPDNRGQRLSSEEIFNTQDSHPAGSAEDDSSDPKTKKWMGEGIRVRMRNCSVPTNSGDLTAEIRSLWESEFAASFPDVSPITWSSRQSETLLAYSKRWRAAHSGYFSEFVQWCVRNWRVVIVEEFQWMTKPPAPQIPSVPFFVKFSHKFEGTFARRKELEDMLSLPTRERLIRELINRGMPRNVAEAETDQKLTVSRQLIDVELQRAELSRERVAFARLQTQPLQRCALRQKMVVQRPLGAKIKEVGEWTINAPERFDEYR